MSINKKTNAKFWVPNCLESFVDIISSNQSFSVGILCMSKIVFQHMVKVNEKISGKLQYYETEKVEKQR